MDTICFLEEHWKELVATFVAVFGLFKYFDARKKELNWKKTEFLFEQSKYIDSDDDIQFAIRVIDGEDKLKINRVINTKGCFTTENASLIKGMHNLFNLLDRLAYAVTVRNSISMEEVAHFGWYFTSIRRNKTLVSFCNSNGYKQVIELAEDVEKYFKENG